MLSDENQPRPLWPYALGMIGGCLFAAGAFFLYVVTQSRNPGNNGTYAFLALALGSAVLGIGWIGALKHDQGGFGAVSGCFAVTLSLLYAYLHRNDWAEFGATGTMVLLAFVWFAAGLLVARGLRATKIPAAIAILGVFGAVYESISKTRIDHGTQELVSLVMFVGLGITGLVCAFELFSLRRATNELL